MSEHTEAQASEETRGERIRATPEGQLWCSVIKQAVEYACGGTILASEDESQSVRTRANLRREARAWLMERHGQYEELCEWLDLDPDYLRAGVARRLARLRVVA